MSTLKAESLAPSAPSAPLLFDEFDPEYLYQLEQDILNELAEQLNPTAAFAAPACAESAPQAFSSNSDMDMGMDADTLRALEYEEYEEMYLAEQIKLL